MRTASQHTLRQPSTQPSCVRCAIYLRVSTDNQLRPEGSLVSQKQRLEAAIKARSTDAKPWEVTGTFVDEAKSGGSMVNRDQFQAMLLGIRRGDFDAVAVTEISRASRNLRDFIGFMEELRERGIWFIAVSQGVDTSMGPTGEAILKLLAVLAELEREWTRERTRANMQARLERGIYNGGVRLYGYESDKSAAGGLRVIEDQAAVVRLIYEEYLAGSSYERLAKSLGERAILRPEHTSRRGKRRAQQAWKVIHLRRLLQNPAYIAEAWQRPKKRLGQRHSDGDNVVRVPMRWEPIVSREVFEAVQQRIAQRARGGYRPMAQRGYAFLLGGILTCAHCGVAMNGSSARSAKGKPTHLYYCHVRGGQKPDCPLRTYVPAKPLERLVLDRLDQLVRDGDLLQSLVDEANREAKQGIDDVRTRIQAKETETRRLAGQLNDIADNIGELKASQGFGAMRKRLDELAALKAAAEAELLALRRERVEAEEMAISKDELALVLGRCQGVFNEVPPALQRDIMRHVVTAARLRADRLSIEIRGDQRWTAMLRDRLSKGSAHPGNDNTPLLLEWRAHWLPGEDSNLRPSD